MRRPSDPSLLPCSPLLDAIRDSKQQGEEILAAFDAGGRADEGHASAPRDQRFGERDARKEMAAGAAARDHHVPGGDGSRLAHPASRASESSTPTSASTIIIAEPP